MIIEPAVLLLGLTALDQACQEAGELDNTARLLALSGVAGRESSYKIENMGLFGNRPTGSDPIDFLEKIVASAVYFRLCSLAQPTPGETVNNELVGFAFINYITMDDASADPADKIHARHLTCVDIHGNWYTAVRARGGELAVRWDTQNGTVQMYNPIRDCLHLMTMAATSLMPEDTYSITLLHQRGGDDCQLVDIDQLVHESLNTPQV